MYEPVLTKHWGKENSHTIDYYIKNGGYNSFSKLFSKSPNDIIELVKASGLRGRGGAGFPTGMNGALFQRIPESLFIFVLMQMKVNPVLLKTDI